MKTTTLTACAALARASCSTVTPPEWDGTPNPLDTPGVQAVSPASEGNFGHEWMWR